MGPGDKVRDATAVLAELVQIKWKIWVRVFVWCGFRCTVRYPRRVLIFDLTDVIWKHEFYPRGFSRHVARRSLVRKLFADPRPLGGLSPSPDYVRVFMLREALRRGAALTPAQTAELL